MRDLREINYISVFNELGYGQCGKNILIELNKLAKVNYWPIGQPDIVTLRDKNLIQECNGNTTQIPNLAAPCIKLWHQHDMAQFAGRGPRIGFPIFELDRFTEHEKNSLRNCDYIFVCSDWAKGIVINNLPEFTDRVCVIPLGVDLHGIKPKPSVDGPTKFFNCGKWEIRKGHDILPEIFCRAFTQEDDVELYLMCDNVFLDQAESDKWKDKYLSCPLGNKVFFIPRCKFHNNVIDIMNSMDCGIFPARAEGWNLELLEMMSLGKNVITTYYAGHTQFCNKENAMLTSVSENTVPAYDGKWFFNQGNWADLDDINIDTMVDHMRTIHKAKIGGYLKQNQVGIETGKKYTWKNTANEILRNLKEIF